MINHELHSAVSNNIQRGTELRRVIDVPVQTETVGQRDGVSVDATSMDEGLQPLLEVDSMSHDQPAPRPDSLEISRAAVEYKGEKYLITSIDEHGPIVTMRMVLEAEVMSEQDRLRAGDPEYVHPMLLHVRDMIRNMELPKQSQ